MGHGFTERETTNVWSTEYMMFGLFILGYLVFFLTPISLLSHFITTDPHFCGLVVLLSRVQTSNDHRVLLGPFADNHKQSPKNDLITEYRQCSFYCLGRSYETLAQANNHRDFDGKPRNETSRSKFLFVGFFHTKYKLDQSSHYLVLPWPS